MTNLRNFDELQLDATETNAQRVVVGASYSPLILQGEPAPSERQVAAVLRALADHTHNMLMTSPDFIAHGEDGGIASPQWRHAMALGRYFHYLADDLTK
jgi:hypothetical protein